MSESLEARIEALGREFDERVDHFKDLTAKATQGVVDEFLRGYRLAWGRSATFHYEAAAAALRALLADQSPDEEQSKDEVRLSPGVVADADLESRLGHIERVVLGRVDQDGEVVGPIGLRDQIYGAYLGAFAHEYPGLIERVDAIDPANEPKRSEAESVTQPPAPDEIRVSLTRAEAEHMAEYGNAAEDSWTQQADYHTWSLGHDKLRAALTTEDPTQVSAETVAAGQRDASGVDCPDCGGYGETNEGEDGVDDEGNTLYAHVPCPTCDGTGEASDQ